MAKETTGKRNPSFFLEKKKEAKKNHLGKALLEKNHLILLYQISYARSPMIRRMTFPAPLKRQDTQYPRKETQQSIRVKGRMNRRWTTNPPKKRKQTFSPFSFRPI